MTTERWWKKLPESLRNSRTVLTMIDMLWVLETKLENRRREARQKQHDQYSGLLDPVLLSILGYYPPDPDLTAEKRAFEDERTLPCCYKIEFVRPNESHPEPGNTVIPIAVITDKAEADKFVELLKAANPNLLEGDEFSITPIKAFPTAAEALALMTFSGSNFLKPK